MREAGGEVRKWEGSEGKGRASPYLFSQQFAGLYRNN